MHSADNFLFRTVIVLCMLAAVIIILYLTPLPNKFETTCERSCHEYDWPMICRVKLILEKYPTRGRSCQSCLWNSSRCNEKCLVVDGSPRNVLTVNRQMPGPQIQVCHNDVLVVDVVNNIPGQSLSIHWRGQPQHESPFMDGVPMITQCPITSYTTFQYKFRASSPGTHLYHAHSSPETSGSFFGALIVKEADRIDPNKKFYDVDDKDHVILISEWQKILLIDSSDKEELNSILINGKAPDDMMTFIVRKGKRYRFRAAYIGGVKDCPISLEVEHHSLKIIALDGNPTTSYEVSSIVLSKGERIDFILTAKRKIFDYALVVKSLCDNALTGSAVVTYEKNSSYSNRKMHRANDSENAKRIFDTGFCQGVLDRMCISDVHSLKKMPKVLRSLKIDKKIYLSFDYKILLGKDDSTSKQFFRMNNITFTYPSSPLLTQFDDISLHSVCHSERRPEMCYSKEICECVHIESISLDSSVEILLINQGGGTCEHVFHLHGQSFYVVGARQFKQVVSINQIKQLDKQNKLFKRNLMNAVLKDTIRVPLYGVVAMRFVAKNPGFWMLRDEKSNSWTRGMDIVFKIGDNSNILSKPVDFPSCGSWIGPDYFLT